MSTITTILSTDFPKDSRAVINTNFTNLNTDKAETASPTFTGTPVAPTAAVGTSTTQIATTAFVSASLSYTNGVTTRDLTTASGTQTIAHGLGRIPKKVTLSANYVISGGVLFGVSGVYNGTTNNCVVGWAGGAAGQLSSSVFAIALGTDQIPTTAGQTGIVTVDSTNITITWTKIGTPTGTPNFMWQVQ